MGFDVRVGRVSISILGEVEIDQERFMCAVGVYFHHEVFWIDVTVEDVSFIIHFMVNWANNEM